MGVSTDISELDSVHKIEYLANDINTSSVTLFPSRAQVYRDIKGVQLQQGTNEITIRGLSQTVDPDSIKVESNGIATITNLEVESVTNRQLFDEVYPRSDSESESESDEEDLSDDETREDDEQLTSARDSLQELQDALAIARDGSGNAERRLHLLENLEKLGERKENKHIQSVIKQYKAERANAFQDLTENNNLQKKLSKEVEKAEKKYNKLQREEDKKNAKEDKAKAKAKKGKEKKKALKDRLKGEARREKERLRDEQQEFWPLEVYSVRITLEVATFTPMTSRRGSMSNDADFAKVSVVEAEGDEDAGPVDVDLTFSYVTTSAYWTPSYDLQLSTTNSTGTLYFDAMLTNQTSESWKGCKVTLSTSQATFSGRYEKIPTISPWHIKLSKATRYSENNIDITRSDEEMMNSSSRVDAPKRQNNIRRMMMMKNSGPADNTRQGPFSGGAPRDFRGSVGVADHSHMAAACMLSEPVPTAAVRPAQAQQKSSNSLQDYDFDPWLDQGAEGGNDGYDASLVEEMGLTTTYDLPTLKTLVPKRNGSKQRVARIPFTNIIFSHTVVAKYKPMAYLKAKLKNSSKMALLRGSASLTLDGTFMGKTSLPRCSCGESFNLSLGVDPAIKVTYPKPEVRRTSVGLFNKEESSLYVRTVTLNNTRAVGGKAVTLLVLDQVPVSEDERLRVELTYPRGLTVDCVNGVSVGEPGKAGKDANWGKASAKLKKDGQVAWDVNLNAGKTVKLSLEYAISIPSGEVAHQV